VDEKSGKKQYRVRLKIHPLNFVARRDIYELQVMADHPFVTAHIGTNFKLKPNQASAIERLIAGPAGPTPEHS
jgi:hypothetical protein